MELHDDQLEQFEAQGAAPLPLENEQGSVIHDGARIWYAAFGSGPAVILLHGGLGHSGNWGYQVPYLIQAGYRVVVIDSRGHGRSTRDDRPYTYELMASDVRSVMDRLLIEKAAVVGWSDGACIGLVLAAQIPERVSSVFFFACNMDPSGTKEADFSNAVLGRCYSRHVKDYAALSETPAEFENFSAAVGEMMKTEPNYSATELAKIETPVAVVLGEHDEFIKREHIEYLAGSLPNAELQILPGVSHFAPLQRPEEFNRAVLEFLARTVPRT